MQTPKIILMQYKLSALCVDFKEDKEWHCWERKKYFKTIYFNNEKAKYAGFVLIPCLAGRDPQNPFSKSCNKAINREKFAKMNIFHYYFLDTLISVIII